MTPLAPYRSDSRSLPLDIEDEAAEDGTRTRLARDLPGHFGSDAYAQEELRAEPASVFIGSTLGLPAVAAS